MPFNEPEFEITHVCNKMCENCSHRISTSDFRSVTIEEMEFVLSCFSIDYKKNVNKVLIIGGEPLCHPQWQDVFLMIRNAFPKKKIVVSTNGSLIDNVPKQIFNKFHWRISEYPGWNDEIIKKYEGKPHVSISHWGNWWPLEDPNIDLKTAKEVEKKCFHQVRIIGTKLYRCCLGNGVERTYNTKKVHAEMSKNWEQDWKKIQIWHACKHCYKSNVILGKWKKNKNKGAKHE